MVVLAPEFNRGHFFNSMKQLLCACLLFTGLVSCGDSQHNNHQNLATKKEVAKSRSPIKDPNNPKPMALMMRLMAAHADSMRSKLLREEAIDSAEFPFLRFYLTEPTDPKVLEPQFFENARLFQQAYKSVFTHPQEQVKYYNNMINSCIHCHESYCNGPLKRIRKFPIL